MNVVPVLAVLAGALALVGGATWTVLDAQPAIEATGILPQTLQAEAVYPAGRPPPQVDPTIPGTPPPTTQSPPLPPSPDPVEPDPPASEAPTENATAEQEAARRAICVNYGWHCRTYTWEFRGEPYWLVLELDPWVYDTYRSEPKPVRLRDSGLGLRSEPAYDVYVSDLRDDMFVGRLATELRRIADAAGIAPEDAPAFALAFVQGLPYSSDEVTTGFDEYPRYPVETLVDAGGDCEDTSILFASILNAWGLDPALLSTTTHMGVGVPGSPDLGDGVAAQGQHYLYAETTGDGWAIGTVPPDVEGALRWWSLEPTPLYSMRDVGISGQGTRLTVQAVVTNLGSVAGTALVEVDLLAEDGRRVATAACTLDLVRTRAAQTCTVTLDASSLPQKAKASLELRASGYGETHQVLRTTSFVPFP